MVSPTVLQMHIKLYMYVHIQIHISIYANSLEWETETKLRIMRKWTVIIMHKTVFKATRVVNIICLHAYIHTYSYVKQQKLIINTNKQNKKKHEPNK